jgi:hypothetical protein
MFMKPLVIATALLGWTFARSATDAMALTTDHIKALIVGKTIRARNSMIGQTFDIVVTSSGGRPRRHVQHAVIPEEQLPLPDGRRCERHLWQLKAGGDVSDL